MSEKRYYVRVAPCNYESCSRTVFIRYFYDNMSDYHIQLNEHFNRLEIFNHDHVLCGYVSNYIRR